MVWKLPTDFKIISNTKKNMEIMEIESPKLIYLNLDANIIYIIHTLRIHSLNYNNIKIISYYPIKFVEEHFFSSLLNGMCSEKA